MAKHKRKAIAAATRGKASLHDPAPDNPDHDRSIVLAVKALSSSSFPPLTSAVCSSILEPILEAALGLVSLDDIIVDDCSEDDALAGDLLDEEQLDFSFTDDDCEDLLPSPPLFPPPAGLIPSPLSGGCPPSTTVVAGSSPPSGGKVWTDLFSTGKQSTPCTKLQKFSLNYLTKTCAISLEDFQPQFEVWNLYAVGYVSCKCPDYRALNGIISSVWKCEASLTIHTSGWLIYRFSREEDKSSVLCGGLYLVYGRPLILKSMTKFFDFSSEEMTKAPVWVKFPNLPLCYWSPSCLSKIASVLGKPIQCDHMTSSLSRMSYARVLIELDLREDLQHSVAVSLPSGPILN